MKRYTFKLALILTLLVGNAMAADDLKTYYENQKAEIRPSFTAPQLGSQVSLRIANGQSRSGILMKLGSDSITLMSETGTTIHYKRSALHETSRAQFFAEDYAHVKALEKTRQYKGELHKNHLAQQAAEIHDGRISVSAKTEKSSDKKVEKEERELKQSGEKRVYTTTTKTYTEQVNLNIDIYNQAVHPDTFSLEYFFFGQRIAKGEQTDKKDDEVSPGTLSVKDKGLRKVTIDSRGKKSIKLVSKPFIITKTEVDTGSRYSSNREPSVAGNESAGWLVLLLYDGRILDRKASSSTYLSDEWIEKYR
ncbi:hypothetical protein [Pontiella agarivorans]|uniref:Uncharacterized protein n=1 Tax=Pontiella agarivorans TaxID=3038953 RepID=A0ABU5MTQ4_9BACT|nr:hypothetical protein [Pontiella agarivorans]MDZ8117591.1 hypothetical protein [Pontiella agarivorans]